jgi:hypothetical protein
LIELGLVLGLGLGLGSGLGLKVGLGLGLATLFRESLPCWCPRLCWC